MSVLACDRVGCGNIMCDRLSHELGYICDECFAEFIAAGNIDAEGFMESYRGVHRDSDFMSRLAEEVFPRVGGDD